MLNSIMNIYIVDYLGVHSGMHYYHEAFKKNLANIPEATVSILSNYPGVPNGIPFFVNQYQGTKIRKIMGLLRNLMRLLRFARSHRADCFIYLTYGNGIDLPFMQIIAKAPNHVIDIHEAIAQNIDSNRRLLSQFRRLYATRIRAVIVHSQRTDDFLDQYGYKGLRFHVPHFKYCFQKRYYRSLLSPEILGARDEKRLNVLFFGNLSYDKGIDLLIETVNSLSEATCKKLNIIVAGKDFDGAVQRHAMVHPEIFHLFLRHIEDDELVWLYEHTDYVILPYRKTSQSGILEMAFYFRKPILASDIPYFRKMLTEFPSFGLLMGNGTTAYATTLEEIAEQHGAKAYFSDADYNRYTHRREIHDFVAEFAEWIKGRLPKRG